jgi:hypothetical protein
MKSRAWFIVIGFILLTVGSRTAQMSRVDILPTGTFLNVRTTQPIAANSTHVGMRYSAIVDDPLADANGYIVVPRGASATLEVVGVQESSNLKGRDRIALKVLSLHVGSRSYSVATSRVELKGPSEGKKAGRKILGGAGIGAAVGGLLGGGTGAAIGATAGGTTGAIVAGSGKAHLNVPAETRLQFQLHAPVRIQR